MNLRRVTYGNKFTVGNLNDYTNIINKTNVNQDSNVTVEDLQELEKDYSNLVLSYNIETSKEKNAIKTYKINESLYLNILLI